MDDSPSPPSDRRSRERFLRTIQSFRPRRWRSFARHLGRALRLLGVLALFAVSLIAGLLLHVGLREGRAVTRSLVNAALRPVFRGRLEVGEIERLSFAGARIREVSVFDPDGVEVIFAEGVEARIATWTLLRGIWSGDEIPIDIGRARIERARVTLSPDESVIPSIAWAFFPRDEGPPSVVPGPAVSVRLPDIEIGYAEVRGSVGAPIQAELHRVKAALDLHTDRDLRLDVQETGLAVSELLPATATGTAAYHLRVDFAQGAPDAPPPVTMWGDFGGFLGQIPVSGHMRMEGLTLRATGHLPEVSPSALREVFPWFPLTVDTQAKVSVFGTLPRLGLIGTAELRQGTGLATVVAGGALDISHGVALGLDLTAASLDPRSLFADAPSGRADGRARIDLLLPPAESDPSFRLEATTFTAELLDQPIPPIDAVITLVAGELWGSATIHEEGLPIDARFRVAGERVAFSVVAAAPKLGEAPRLRGQLEGSGSARVDGSLERGKLSAKITASGRGLGVGVPRTLRSDGLTLEAELTGLLSNLSLSGRANLTGASLSGEKLDSVRVRAEGPLLTPRLALEVTDNERGKASVDASLSIEDRAVSNVRFAIERQGEVARGTLRSAKAKAGGVALEGLDITGGTVGALKGSLRIDKDELIGDLSGSNVDLGKLSRLVGVGAGLGGIANVEVHVERVRGGRKGSIELELEQGSFGEVAGISARLSAKLDGDDAIGSGFVRLVDEATPTERAEAAASNHPVLLCDGAIAEVRFANVDATLEGPLLSLGTWRKAHGSAELFAENWNLGCALRRLPERLHPVSELRGLASARLKLKRDKQDKYPSVELSYLGTSGLAVVSKDKSISSDQIDLRATANFDGKSGVTEVALNLLDPAVLARAEATATLDPAKLLSATERAAYAESTPVAASLQVPRRALSDLRSLPKPFRDLLPALDGEVGASLDLSGTAQNPSLFLAVQALGVSPSAAGEWVPPLNLDLTANYEPSTRRSIAGLSVSLDKTPVAIMGAVLELLPAGQMPGAPEPSWKADVVADLYDLPLQAVPALAERDVQGPLSGSIALRGINQQPTLALDLKMSKLQIHDVKMQALLTGSVRSDKGADPNKALGKLRLDVAQAGGGRLQVDGTAGMRFADGVVPVLDWSTAGRIVASAKEFSIAPLYPLVADVLSKLDGTIDGGLELLWGEMGQADKGRVAKADFTLSDGVAYIPQLGQELREGKANVRVAPPRADGMQELRLTDLEAQGTSGRVVGSAIAILDGLRLSKLTTKLAIEPGQELPITVEGVPLGKASGEITLEATPFGGDKPSRMAQLGPNKLKEGFDVEARVLRAVFELPNASSRDVISLDDAPGLRVKQPLAPPVEKRAETAWGYAMRLAVESTEVKSQALNLKLRTEKDSPIEIELSDRLHTRGDVELSEGSIVLNSKTFELDEGLVQLRDEDTGNPWVSLTAHWEADDDSRVFVDYRGLLKPITDDKIVFRSDPPRSQEEIVRLLVFGESAATATNLAGTVGSSVASSLANELIAGAFGGVLRDVLALNVGTNDTGGYLGAQVKLSDRFRLGGSVEQVEATTTTTSSTTQQSGSCGDLYFAYKLAQNWSLRGSGGYCGYEQNRDSSQTQGGVSLGLDVFWQFRY